MERTINWQKAIIGGILGTLAFDIVGFIITKQWWDIAGIIGEKTGLGFAGGVAGHYLNGILIAVLYAGIAPSLWGPAWARIFLFTTAETIVLVWFFMLPLLGAGIAGTKLLATLPIITLARHWAYGAVLYFFIPIKTAEKALA